ncbi:MAG: SMC-Scp complex subunit ScpB [Clostridiales bacterium]|nr:SMC-Scp complex subunit ScpB [Clostridiales bacterium]
MQNDDINLKSAIEAILFAAGYPVEIAKIATALDVEEATISRLLSEMRSEYDVAERGIQLLILGDSCQLCTKEEHIDKIRAILGVKRGGNLSRSSLEALAIVAYHQPVTKSYIEQIRGIDSSYAVNNLTEKHLVEVCGRLDAPGHPALYRTTDDFLRVFGITSLNELPPVEIFAEAVMPSGSSNSAEAKS